MTITDIANSALTKLGSLPIMSLDDDNKRAKLVKNRIYAVIETVIRMHVFNCATKRVVTSPLANLTPAFGFEYVHPLPSDCLRVLEINPKIQDDYRIEGRSVYIDNETIEIRYCMDMRDQIQLIDSMTAEAIAAYLAWDICFPLTASRTLKNDIFQDFEMLLRRAKSVDAKEDPPGEVQANEFIDSRFGSGRLDRSGR